MKGWGAAIGGEGDAAPRLGVFFARGSGTRELRDTS